MQVVATGSDQHFVVVVALHVLIAVFFCLSYHLIHEYALILNESKNKSEESFDITIERLRASTRVDDRLQYLKSRAKRCGSIGDMHELVIIFAKYVIVVPVLALAFVFFRLSQRRRLEMAAFLAVSVVFTLLLAKVGAALHQDPRPFVRDGVTPYFGHSRDNGFPSDHTTYSALIAFVALRYNRWLGVSLAAVSVLVGTARVVAGVHHGQDIVGGFLIAAIGTGIGFAILLGAKTLYVKQKGTKLPA